MSTAMQITDEMVAAAYNTFVAAVNDTAPCGRCATSGYHHGFGENGHDPDWCSVCGGSGFVPAHDEMSAMRLALEAAKNTDQTESGAGLLKTIKQLLTKIPSASIKTVDRT